MRHWGQTLSVFSVHLVYCSCRDDPKMLQTVQITQHLHVSNSQAPPRLKLGEARRTKGDSCRPLGGTAGCSIHQHEGGDNLDVPLSTSGQQQSETSVKWQCALRVSAKLKLSPQFSPFAQSACDANYTPWHVRERKGDEEEGESVKGTKGKKTTGRESGGVD